MAGLASGAVNVEGSKNVTGRGTPLASGAVRLARSLSSILPHSPRARGQPGHFPAAPSALYLAGEVGRSGLSVGNRA